MSPGTALVLIDARAATRALAAGTGLHPELVRRLVVLGAVDPIALDAAARLTRLVRLRRDLGLNVAGAALACDLLARIEALEARGAELPNAEDGQLS